QHLVYGIHHCLYRRDDDVLPRLLCRNDVPILVLYLDGNYSQSIRATCDGIEHKVPYLDVGHLAGYLLYRLECCIHVSNPCFSSYEILAVSIEPDDCGGYGVHTCKNAKVIELELFLKLGVAHDLAGYRQQLSSR